MRQKKTWVEWAWDLWCVASVIGLWPRFIEPRLLSVTKLVLPIPGLSSSLSGLKILQFSDLHWSRTFSSLLKCKLIRKISRLQPDLIVFTGDFLCRSTLENKEELKNLLSSLYAPCGCFAIMGNHDYERFITVNEEGDYDVEPPSEVSDIGKGFKRLFSSITPTGQATASAKKIGLHQELVDLLSETPFRLLNNETQLVTFRDSKINVCGLEEYSLGRFNPKKAFQNYDSAYPGIVLSHNPDTITHLRLYPGDVILAGHTHGGQVNLPFLWKKFTCIEHLEFKSGLKSIGKRWAYINRGLASVMRFRWFAMPELTLLTLQMEQDG